MFTIDEIKEVFPFDKARPGQLEIIQKITDAFEEGYKFVVLEAPTGSGKSVIGTTISRLFGNSYNLTINKILQDQMIGDFGENGLYVDHSNPLIDLKGRNAYECTYYKHIINNQPELEKIESSSIVDYLKNMAQEYINCARGECKKMGKGKIPYCTQTRNICPYHIQLNKAINADHVLMNFHSFIFQTQLVPQRWEEKNLIVVDEAHNQEAVLMDYVSLSFSDLPFGVVFPKLDSPEEYAIYFDEIGMLGFIKSKVEQAVSTNNEDDEEYWLRQLFKYENFKKNIFEDEWVVKFESKEIGRNKYVNTVEFKPLYVRKFSHIIFKKAQHVLMMSATILSPSIMMDALGIEKDQYKSFTMPNLFPVENRKIFYQPSGSMAYKNKKDTIPKLISDINNILNDHEEERGIIHSHSFELTNAIVNGVDHKHKRRITCQSQYPNKNELLKIHADKSDSVLISPSLQEGLDLKDDLSRFQILPKVPYPSYIDNPQLKRRMEISSDYYNFVTALRLVQSVGRSIRSDKDYATTYILDGDFKQFFLRCKRILPEWFMEAIVWK